MRYLKALAIATGSVLGFATIIGWIIASIWYTEEWYWDFVDRNIYPYHEPQSWMLLPLITLIIAIIFAVAIGILVYEDEETDAS